MKRLRTYLSSFDWKKILPWVILLTIFLANGLHATYPDEFDNILGGKLILAGKLPYTGFFSHHGPLAYYLSAGLVFLGGQSFVHFRLLSAIFFLGLFAVYYLIIVHRLPKIDTRFFWAFAFLTALAAIYFWGQMFLADPLSGFLLIPAYLVVFYRTYFREILKRKDFWIVSIFSALAVINSQSYLYAAVVIYAVATIHQWTQRGAGLRHWGQALKELFLESIVLLIPYLFFFVYLVLTGSLGNFLNQAVEYNQRYYIYNYPRPAGGSWQINPIRYAIVIFNDFQANFQLALSGVFSFNPRFPLTHTLIVSDVILLVWLLYKRRPLTALLVIGSLIYVNARGNPSQINPKDYQTSVYFMLSILNFALGADLLVREVNKLTDSMARTVFTLLTLMLGVYWLYGALSIFSYHFQIDYNRYMGTYPLIYDRPVVAATVNAVVSADEYCWVGPFEFEELFYLKCRLPSKFHWILPQFANIPAYQKQIIDDYSKNKPKIIVFRRDFSAFNLSPDFNLFFVKFLNSNYVRLADLTQYKDYRFPDQKIVDFHPNDDFNFERQSAPQIIDQLIALGYIKHL